MCTPVIKRPNYQIGGANAELSRTDLSNGIGALLAIRLDSMVISPSLPHVANGRFNAITFADR
jgi:hypothetical protein